ncbi:MAG: hypothetical protein QOE36_2014, partial [Gaiellaceae bacterium]|nr:hypothetical protein [Gaiellaceae bacterium]
MDATDLSGRRARGLELAREGDAAGLPELRIAVVSTHNLDLLTPFLAEALERAGFSGDVYLGPFGQLPRELLDPSSGLYEHRPSAVVLVPAVEDLLAPLYERPATASADLVDERLEELRGLVSGLLERAPEATCYVVAAGPERLPGEHVLDPGSPQRGQTAVEALLGGLRALGDISSRVVVVDFESRVRALGLDRIHDPRLWYLARMRLGQEGVAALADSLAEHVAAAQGRPRKVVALDADDLLWGGIVGEAGVGGIELGGDGLGLAFADLQRILRGLRDSGVLLAICSKNEPADVDEVLDTHPEMVLRREDFAAIRAGWEDKATSLRALADELDLGLDSFVFLDDNPFEREWVREAL